MKVSDLADMGMFNVLTGGVGLDNEVGGVYVCDLLSWVMGRAREGDAWITIQGHLNVVAVASLVGCACIIAAEGAPVNPDTIAKAASEDIPIMSTSLSSYEVCKTLAKALG